MNIDELRRYGVDPELIDIWRTTGHERLLPVQWLAVQRYDLFAGRNLIISAPTSSGKTVVGEMAAAKAIHDKGKVFYLVPLKAMKMALMLDEWASGRPAIDIEERFQSLSGTIRAAGEVCGWLVDATAAIADMLKLHEHQIQILRDLSVQLMYGVSAEGVPLCRVGVRGFGRTHVQKLLDAGIADMDALRAASQEALIQILGKAMGRKVRTSLDRAASRQQGGASAEAPSSPVEREDGDIGQPDAPAPQFRCSDRLHLDGAVDKRRTVIAINGAQHAIPTKTFAILLRLAAQLQGNGSRQTHLGRVV